MGFQQERFRMAFEQPGQALCFRGDSDRPTRRIPCLPQVAPVSFLLLLLAVTSLPLLGCAHSSLGTNLPREISAPPAHLQPVFPAWGVERVVNERQSNSDFLVESLSFHTYDDVLCRHQVITGEVYVPSGAGPHPVIEVSPILGGAFTGYAECRFFSARMARRGFLCFFLHQDHVLLDPALDAMELERRLRSVTRATIKGLDVVLEEYSVDLDRIGSFGISFGGIRNVPLIAAEPRLRANVLCLAGGNLEGIIRSSSEGLVRYYLQGRRERGWSRAEVLADLGSGLPSDPVWMAQHVDPRRLLLINAKYDDVVLPVFTEQLVEALGFPERWVVPFGHYTAVLIFPWAVNRAEEFYVRIWGERRERQVAAASSASP